MKEPPVHAAPVQQTHRAGVTVRQNRFGVFLGDGFQPCGDSIKGLIPRDSCESAFTLLPGAFHRVQQPVRIVGALLVVRDLDAETAVRIRIRRIAFHADGAAAIVNFNQHRARIGTIVRADCSNRFHRLALLQVAGLRSGIFHRTQ